jgi:hypothetical protein
MLKLSVSFQFHINLEFFEGSGLRLFICIFPHAAVLQDGEFLLCSGSFYLYGSAEKSISCWEMEKVH